ncbi:hypothetical protein L208DRAFT_1391465 [Tricholoma matsutake]|nr:hypothetical protein L208DRAFT_1391465 [Tricholoma matsutake 945]
MYEPISTQMTTDSPPLSSVRKQPNNPNVSPAQAIADAWKRESAESQEKWRRIDANVRLRYNSPPRSDPKSRM